MIRDNIKAHNDNKADQRACFQRLMEYGMVGADAVRRRTMTPAEMKALNAEDVLENLRALLPAVERVEYFGPLTEEELKQTVRAFVTDTDRRGYFRLRIRHALHRDCDPDKVVEQLIAGHEEKARFNPQTLYENLPDETHTTNEEVVFEVEEFQQMTDPLTFIRKTINQYPNLEQKSLEDDFRLISARVRQMDETMDNNKQETL
jgi:hypothetical protein